MTTLCKPYETRDAADRAVAALLDAGVPGEDVRVLMAARMHDARGEAAGGFAGEIASGAHVGAFGGAGAPRNGTRGSFAGSGERPEGVFGNADRDVVVTYADGAEQTRVAGHHLLEGLLMDAGLDAPTAQADVRSLHDGRVLVLVHAGAIEAGDARTLLDGAVAAAA
jgi:hypothetical protein